MEQVRCKSIASRSFIDFLETWVRDEWKRAVPRKGIIFRALKANTAIMGESRRTEVLMCVDLILSMRKAKRFFCQLSSNVAAWQIYVSSPTVRVQIVRDNLCDEEGKAIDNRLQNKFLLVLSAELTAPASKCNVGAL